MDKRIGLCIDVGHTARSGPDVAVKESQVAVGEGKMPVKAIFESLHGIG